MVRKARGLDVEVVLDHDRIPESVRAFPTGAPAAGAICNEGRRIIPRARLRDIAVRAVGVLGNPAARCIGLENDSRWIRRNAVRVRKGGGDRHGGTGKVFAWRQHLDVVASGLNLRECRSSACLKTIDGCALCSRRKRCAA